MGRGKRGRKANPQRRSRGLSKSQKGLVKDIVHKQSDRSRLLRPKWVPVLPEIKQVPKNSITVRTRSTSWWRVNDSAKGVVTMYLNDNILAKAFIDYNQIYYQVESISVFGPRTPSYVAGSSDTWQPVTYNVGFGGSFTSGTASDINLFDIVQTYRANQADEGRQKVPYVLSDRDKQFVFESVSRSTPKGVGKYTFVLIAIPSTTTQRIMDDFVADVRVTRWGTKDAAWYVGDPAIDLELSMALALMRTAAGRLQKSSVEELSDAVSDDVKLSQD